jgi:hypothetical protein
VRAAEQLGHALPAHPEALLAGGGGERLDENGRVERLVRERRHHVGKRDVLQIDVGGREPGEC